MSSPSSNAPRLTVGDTIPRSANDSGRIRSRTILRRTRISTSRDEQRTQQHASSKHLHAHGFDLARARQLIAASAASVEEAPGEARKVDAFRSADSCSNVESFYARQMPAAHWTHIAPHVQLNSGEFAQEWRYSSRSILITGASSSTGCTVMIANYSRTHNRYESK